MADPEEIELKLTVLDPPAIRALVVDPAAHLPGVVALGEARAIAIEDRYLDTPGRALAAGGLVARLRSGAGGRRLTIKSLVRGGSGGVHRRLELEGDAGDPDDPDDPRAWPPGEARDRLLEAIGPAPLATLVRIRQRRLQRDVSIGASVVELSLDEIEVVGTVGPPGGWVELEAELRAGSEADLARLGEHLLRRPDLRPAATSKLERAMAVVEDAR